MTVFPETGGSGMLDALPSGPFSNSFNFDQSSWLDRVGDAEPAQAHNALSSGVDLFGGIQSVSAAEASL